MPRIVQPPRRLALACSVAIVALMAGHAALAETAGSGDASAVGGAIDEVVVTVSKRAENLQSVPASVSAITGDKLEQLNAGKLEDYASYLPGFNVSSGGTPGQTSITLRGVAPVGRGSLVGMYVDDTSVGSSTAYARAASFALDLMPYDLERLEVLRGPQGTLYGASAMGGILKYVLNTPDLTRFSGRVGADLFGVNGAGEAGWGLRGSVNIPVVSDRLAVSASAYDQRTPGYVDSVRAGVKDSNDLSQTGGRIAVFVRPTDNLSVKLNAMWQRIDSDDNAQMALTVDPVATTDGSLIVKGVPLHGDLTQDTYFLTPFKKDMAVYSVAVNWDLGPVDLISATSYSRSRTAQVQDATILFGSTFPFFGVAPGMSRFEIDLGLDRFSQEFRLQSKTGGKIEWILGGYYNHENSVNDAAADATTFAGAPIPDFLPVFAFQNLLTSYDEYAAFGDVTVHFTDRFDITAGGRYAHDSQKFRQVSGGGTILPTVDSSSQSSEGVFTWMINPRFRVSQDAMVYARVATGFRPGGPNVLLPGTDPTFDPDKLINYEAGFKAELFDRRATFDLSAFYIDWSNIQLTMKRPGGTSFLGNGGDAVSKGFELETAFYPVNGLRLGFNAAYTDATLKSLNPDRPNSNGLLVGYRLPQVPKWSGALTAEYSFPVAAGWTGRVGGGARYTGERFSDTVNTKSQVVILPSYSMFDLSAGVSNDRWSIKLFARNVTDKRAYSAAGVQTDIFGSSIETVAAIVQPRTIGLGVDVSF